MIQTDCLIVGGGPCGLSTAIELEEIGLESVVIEKGNIVQTIYDFPTHQTFFSTSEKLEIGGVAFITEKSKPTRLDALTYYRSVALRKDIKINNFETVLSIKKERNSFFIKSITNDGKVKHYEAGFVVIATGYYTIPNELNVPGSDLAHVMHYFKEGHPYFRRRVTVIGGRNSAIDASIELHRAGAHVTVLYRGETYSESIKPWILPEFDRLIQNGEISMVFEAEIEAITNKAVKFSKDAKTYSIPSDFVFAMIGYQPDVRFLKEAQVIVDERSGIPQFNELTYETNVSNLYLAGVVTAGFNNNAIFIENGRFHGKKIANNILHKINE